jgi:hypothetical protein
MLTAIPLQGTQAHRQYGLALIVLSISCRSCGSSGEGGCRYARIEAGSEARSRRFIKGRARQAAPSSTRGTDRRPNKIAGKTRP